AQADVRPIVARGPTHEGLSALPPQRHRDADVTRATTRPVPLMISRLPRTRSGPFGCGSIASTPSRVGSMSVLPLGGSPVAEKPIFECVPSQKGLFADAPQRQRVARKPAGAPSISSWPRNAYGPASGTPARFTGS